jgi:hypothetical protein
MSCSLPNQYRKVLFLTHPSSISAKNVGELVGSIENNILAKF